MVKCSAYKCTNASYKETPEISFHRFPKNENSRNAWIKNMNRANWQPTASSVLCSQHFQPNLIDKDGFRPVLTKGAIPTIFELSEERQNSTASTSSQNLPMVVVQKRKASATEKSAASEENKENISTAGLAQPPDKKIRTEHTALLEKQASEIQQSYVNTKTVSVMQKEGNKHHTACGQIEKIQQKLIAKNKTIKALREQKRRLKKKVQVFADVIKELKRKLNEEDVEVLKSIPGPGEGQHFLFRYLKKTRNLPLEKQYSPELRSFALQLNFFSPRAYNFVRNTFDTILPHPVTISRWYKKVNAQPGFTSESFDILEEIAKKSKYKTFVNLSLDEMSIKKESVWDGNKFQGRVDTGTEINDDSLPLATLALVLFVTAINASWKLPIAYFFITSMTGIQRANIVRIAIDLLSKINVIVKGITFDGAASNISMATDLGCNFSLDNLKTYFMINGQKINIFWDPCHMLKLIRNTFGDYKIFIDSEGNHINFEFINQLFLLQERKGLHIANKLRQAHILFYKQKMKVRLAAQLFSRSVADALQYARETLKITDFNNSQATEKFIILINNCFDILNSRSMRPPGFKKALCLANIERTVEFVNSSIEYLKNLKLPNHQPLVLSARKTGFVGFVVSLTSALSLFQELVVDEKMTFISTYKISQDHLEMFFGKMRSRGGYNDNPNVIQFKSAYKKNLIISEINLNKSGAFTEHISILNSTSTIKETSVVTFINNTTRAYESNKFNYDEETNDKEVESFFNAILSSPLDDYNSHITTYISGFIARKVLKKVECSLCQSFVLGNKKDFVFSLINLKDRGGLVYPSQGVINIIADCEKVYKFRENITTAYIVNFIWGHRNYFNLFKSDDSEHDAIHVYLLVRVIITYYVNLRNRHSKISNKQFVKKKSTKEIGPVRK